MPEALIVDAVRTPVGRRGRLLAGTVSLWSPDFPLTGRNRQRPSGQLAICNKGAHRDGVKAEKATS